MRVALVNPNWTFDGSVYFGCREPHLPLELGWSRMLLEEEDHVVHMIDGHLFDLSTDAIRDEVASFRPELIVVTTAPTYLFWRCAPPELRVPMEMVRGLAGLAPRIVAVGPHGSTTPVATLRKLDVAGVVLGECEEVVARIAGGAWDGLQGLAHWCGGEVRVNGGPQAARLVDRGPLHWPDEWLSRHRHHHHRFDAAAIGPGAELEASRGCPYSCSFCAKENFRDRYRRRDADVLLTEAARLKAQGVEYFYFIDEIFLPNQPLLEGLVDLGLKFGIQTRIDLWKPDMLALLGRAGCVSIEAGVESLSQEGRDQLAKNCRLSTEELALRLVEARRHVPFVQANLLEMPQDDAAIVDQWRERLRRAGVWANDPVPLFPYPGSPDYRRLWGLPDNDAWERAVDYYLDTFSHMSELQDARPLPLLQLEGRAA